MPKKEAEGSVELYACARCGSTDVEFLAWVSLDPGTGLPEVTDTADLYAETAWCLACQEPCPGLEIVAPRQE